MLAFLVAFMGCDNAGDGNGTLSILLTDAPGDMISAVVTVDQVYLQAEDSNEDAESSRIVLRDEPATVDLLTLQNEVLDLVDGETVPEGSYHQLRLVISGGYIELEGEGADSPSIIYASSDAYAAEQGVEADGRLQMPSYASSGLKIKLDGDLADIEGDQNVVLLDFNVADSFGKDAGNSGQWVMSPVISATDLAFTGQAELALALEEGVTLPEGTTLADFSADLDKDGETISVPFADEDGDAVYTVDFRYLVPGLYPVTISGPEGLAFETDLAMPFDLGILSGDAMDAAITITAVE